MSPSPSLTGRARPSEEAPNVLLCLGRGALTSATRGPGRGGSSSPILYCSFHSSSLLSLLLLLLPLQSSCFLLLPLFSLPSQGRTRPSEEALDVLLCLVRGALPSATRGPVGEGSSPSKTSTPPSHSFFLVVGCSRGSKRGSLPYRLPKSVAPPLSRRSSPSAPSGGTVPR